jgi:hypothetical protein
MAAYPTLPTSFGADPQNATKLLVDRAEDGTARVRSYAKDKASFKISHPYLDSVGKGTLDAFYAANRLLPFSYTSAADGTTRTCVFSARPTYKFEPGGYYTATVTMEEV